MNHPSRVLLAVLTVGVTAFSAAHAASPVEVAQSGMQPVVQIVTVNGTVTSPQSAILSPSIGGLVERTLVDAGEPLAEQECFAYAPLIPYYKVEGVIGLYSPARLTRYLKDLVRKRLC